MFNFIFKLLRTVAIAAVGTALAAKFLLESNAEPTTEEIDLISIFEGQHLVSKAKPFYGGKVLTMFGGVLLDLRDVSPAPTGIYLDIALAFGGLSIVVPEGWRLRFDGNLIFGGLSDETRTDADDEAPTIHVTGFGLMSGIQVTTKSPVETTATA